MNTADVEADIVEVLENYAQNGGNVHDMRRALYGLMCKYVSRPYEFNLSDGNVATVDFEIDGTGALKS